MNKALAFLSIASISAVVAVGTGCESDEGAVITTWTAEGLTVVGEDTCEFFLDEPLTFDITIDGSTVTMEDADPESSLQASTDSYDSADNEVLLSGTATNDEYAPCVVELGDEFELVLEDPDLSLDQNDTVEVTWDHIETDISANVGDCVGEWFVDLPCSGRATLTLTQE